MTTKIIGPYPGNCPSCGQKGALFRISADPTDKPHNVACGKCQSKFNMEDEGRQQTLRTVQARGARSLPSAPVDWNADGPVAIRRQIGVGDFLMASVVLHGAKLANPNNETYYMAASPVPLQSRDWLLGIPWVDRVVAALPDDFPLDRTVDMQGQYQFDFGWFQGLYERVDVALARASIPDELWPACRVPDYCPAPSVLGEGRDWLKAQGVPDDAKIIKVAVRGLGTPTRRTLPEPYLMELLDRLLRETDARVFARPVGALHNELTAQGTPLERFLGCGDASCDGLVREMYVADLALVTDSGQLHVAACWSTPTIGWFSGSPPWTRMTYYENAVGLFNHDACPTDKHPCTSKGRPNCPEPKCMSGVPIEFAMEIVQEELAKPRVLKVIAPPLHRDPSERGAQAVEALKAAGHRARHVPSTPNTGWPAEANADGTVTVDEGRVRREWDPTTAWPSE